MTASGFIIRPAERSDREAIVRLHRESVVGLASEHFSPSEIAAFLRFVATVDEALIAGSTYYLAETGGELAGAGGWSPGDIAPSGIRPVVSGGPAGSAAPSRAKIRAVFVHPRWARCGLGRHLVTLAETQAAQAGFLEAELLATPTGATLYRALGYREETPVRIALPDGTILTGIHMSKPLRTPVPA